MSTTNAMLGFISSTIPSHIRENPDILTMSASEVITLARDFHCANGFNFPWKMSHSDFLFERDTLLALLPLFIGVMSSTELCASVIRECQPHGSNQDV